MPKNWCFWTVVLDKILESALDCKQIKSVNSKGNQSWIFIGRTDTEAETPILWPPDAKNRLIGKDPDAGKGWRREEKGLTEDEMVGLLSPTWWTGVWAAPWVSDGQRSLACCSPWCLRVGHNWATEQQQHAVCTALVLFNNIVILDSYYTVSEQTINETIQSIFSAHYGIITSSYRLPRWH